MIVLNQLGPRMGEHILAAVPGVEVVDLAGDRPAPPGTRGDVLLAAAGNAHAVAGLLDRFDELGLRWMHLAGTGVDAYPLDAFRGRLVTCARGASAVPIAEYVLAAMLAFEKRLPAIWLGAPPERWSWARLGGLAGRTLGLVGFGGIGQAVARRALAFDMRVVALRRHPDAPNPLPEVAMVGSLADLLADAGHLVLAAPATPRTRHLLDADAFAAVKPGVHLVNIARGTLVDQDALRAALDDGRVAMATLDVVDPEPLPEGHWLYGHPRVRLSPHVSWSSPAMLATLGDAFVANLRRFLAGEPLDGVVDVDEGY